MSTYDAWKVEGAQGGLEINIPSLQRGAADVSVDDQDMVSVWEALGDLVEGLKIGESVVIVREG